MRHLGNGTIRGGRPPYHIGKLFWVVSGDTSALCPPTRDVIRSDGGLPREIPPSLPRFCLGSYMIGTLTRGWRRPSASRLQCEERLATEHVLSSAVGVLARGRPASLLGCGQGPFYASPIYLSCGPRGPACEGAH